MTTHINNPNCPDCQVMEKYSGRQNKMTTHVKKNARLGVFGCDSILTIVGVIGRTAHYVFDHDKAIEPLNPTIHEMDVRGLEKLTFVI